MTVGADHAFTPSNRGSAASVEIGVRGEMVSNLSLRASAEPITIFEPPDDSVRKRSSPEPESHPGFHIDKGDDVEVRLERWTHFRTATED
jgi:hypothetical protein